MDGVQKLEKGEERKSMGAGLGVSNLDDRGGR